MTREAPTYEQTAEAIQQVLDSACMELTIIQDGHPVELVRLARCLDKAGLINWRNVT